MGKSDFDKKAREEFGLTSEPKKESKEAAKQEFPSIASREIIEVLGLTIKRDNVNKLVTFLCLLSAYTEDSQFNISYNAPSSTGKSYIPTEIARLFPPEDVIEVGYCSPTAFFHDVGEYSKLKEGYVLDLSKKILIFLDQPHTLLLQHLRPMLSHDKKEIQMKITDKSQRKGLRTKNIFLRGFPSVVFCTAGLKIDEQEATRFLLLSPEADHEKLREAVCERIKKEADNEAYKSWLEENAERSHLRTRIETIKREGIRNVNISSPQKIEQLFFLKNRRLKPRHQRDIGRIMSLVKVFALLNIWHRQRDGSTIVANEVDIDEAFDVWEVISESQEHNLPPYIYNFYQDIFLPLWKERSQKAKGGFKELRGRPGLTRTEVSRMHLDVYGRMLPDWLLRQQIIPMLESAGLVSQHPDPRDKRRMLIHPTMPLTISGDKYSEPDGGVSQNDKVKEGRSVLR